MTIRPWKTRRSRYALENPWVTVRVDEIETPDGHVIEDYHVIESPDWVHIVAFDPAGLLMINRQYRHGGEVICETTVSSFSQVRSEPSSLLQSCTVNVQVLVSGFGGSFGSVCVSLMILPSPAT